MYVSLEKSRALGNPGALTYEIQGILGPTTEVSIFTFNG